LIEGQSGRKVRGCVSSDACDCENVYVCTYKERDTYHMVNSTPPPITDLVRVSEELNI